MSNVGYEKRDIPVKPVIIGGVIFVLTIVVTLFLLFEYYVRVLDDTVYEFKLSKRSKKLIELRKSESETLNSYKVIDQEKEIYHIPINQSKELLLDDQKK
ncbi:MAG: hypothetical protein P8L43_05285 [Candidatus Marinimicrobia bacterium]|jgi:hypothetical protein|nr:hypothetical protein [Candidatus Neomarinimicrobiota bacterium]|tara:strand:+ start:24 stop:323 length:300 start_codon:yes stop_codon:yes gene_type:complete